MRYTKSSWFPLGNFCNFKCGKDWMLGCSIWSNVKDALTGDKIKKYETVFWNRSLGQLSVSLRAYENVKDKPEYQNKLKSLGLPPNIKV